MEIESRGIYYLIAGAGLIMVIGGIWLRLRKKFASTGKLAAGGTNR
jgi:hypothetical protein